MQQGFYFRGRAEAAEAMTAEGGADDFGVVENEDITSAQQLR